MTCRECQSENPEDSVFCQECGGKLERACPQCGADQVGRARFCRKCGTFLGDPPVSGSAPRATAPEGERRQLTVMFCDLVGSTTLSGQLDPEELREVVHAYREACASVIRRLGGHVAQYLGDGLMVYFGHPRALEDDAQRAVRAGLEIVQAVAALPAPSSLPTPLQVRVGLHTGVVVLGGIGEGGHEHLAMGEVPNVAARLQGMASPDAVLLSEATYRLVQGYFVCEDLGLQALRGRAEPMRVYRAVSASGIQSRFDLQVSTGLTPLVGREEEVALLLRRWDEVCSGHGQVMLLGGEAGIGKSRLLQVLRERLRQQPHVALECRCSAQHESSALYPVIDMLQRFLGFAREDGAAAKRAKLEAALAGYRFAEADTVALFAALLSLDGAEGSELLDLTPERRKRRTMEAIAAWLLEQSERTPVRFALEDLHWADPSTLEFLDLLIDHAAGARLLVVLTHRPEFVPPWALRSYLGQLTLARLPRALVEEMVQRVTGGRALPAPMLSQIVARTDGVPLLVEELTKTMLESGWLKDAGGRYELTGSVPAPVIPATLQDWLMARLDQLAPFREVAQLGATLGREFSDELIRAVSPLTGEALDQALDGLVQAELLYRRGPLGQVRYVFKHALIQDAAYESLLKSRRQQFHERIGRALEERFVETAETQPELVAHHYGAAGLGARAIPYWQRAGDRAATRGAHAEAVRHYGAALTLLADEAAGPARDQRELGLQTSLALSLASTRGYAASEVEQTYNRAYEVCQRLGETAELFPVLRGLCTFYIVRNQQPKARQLAEQCLRIAQESQRVDYLVEGYTPLGYVCFYQGELRQARDLLTQGLELYRAHRGESFAFVTPQDSGVACLGLLANTQWMLGYPDKALRCAYDALALAQELAQPFNLAYAHNYAAGVHSLRGELDKAIEQAQQAFDISSAHGFDVWRVSAMLHLATANAVFGDREQAVTLLLDGLAAWRACGTELLRPMFLVNLAEICRLAGKLDQAVEAVEEARLQAEQCGEREWDSLIYRVRGGLTLATSGDRDAAESDLRRAIAIARAQEARSFELSATIGLSLLLRKLGRAAEAREMLAPLYASFDEGFETWELRNAQAVLEKLG